LHVALLTLGDPTRLTGGYLYQQRMEQLAPRFDARVEFMSLPDRGPAPAVAAAPGLLRRAARSGAHAVVVDSIAAAYLAPWLAGAPPIPLIGLLHQLPGGIGGNPLRFGLRGVLDRATYRRAVRLIVPSAWARDRLVTQGMDAGAIRIVPAGRPALAPPKTARRSKPVILCVANWLRHKGIHHLVEAFARLPAGSATLHLVGDIGADPRYTADITRRLTRSGLRDALVIHGSIPPDAVDALYKSADVFALPAENETYGMAYVEAMAAGLPIVAWMSGNVPYLVRDGKQGLLVPAGDVDGLTAALHALITNQELRRRLGDNAGRRAKTFPTWEESAAIFFGTIRDVAG